MQRLTRLKMILIFPLVKRVFLKFELQAVINFQGVLSLYSPVTVWSYMYMKVYVMQKFKQSLS